MKADEQEKQRRLSPAEQRRLERFQEISAGLIEQGYRQTELTVGIVRANIFALLLAVPVLALGLILFWLKNADSLRFSMRSGFSGAGWLIFLAAVLALTVVHELIHGLTWARFAEHGWQDIEFGFMKEYLTPYCTCGVPLTRGQYILGGLMPLIVLGLIPTVVAICCGSLLLLGIGLVMILGAGGDILIVLRMLAFRGTGRETLYYDHPTRAGVVVFEK
ncbi:MAG: DUF3267 domain-containing protein [Firmicutes bacterium]|nr:DUF3267 domain-containing protein [Bacillota bacterium]